MNLFPIPLQPRTQKHLRNLKEKQNPWQPRRHLTARPLHPSLYRQTQFSADLNHPPPISQTISTAQAVLSDPISSIRPKKYMLGVFPPSAIPHCRYIHLNLGRTAAASARQRPTRRSCFEYIEFAYSSGSGGLGGGKWGNSDG